MKEVDILGVLVEPVTAHVVQSCALEVIMSTVKPIHIILDFLVDLAGVLLHTRNWIFKREKSRVLRSAPGLD